MHGFALAVDGFDAGCHSRVIHFELAQTVFQLLYKRPMLDGTELLEKLGVLQPISDFLKPVLSYRVLHLHLGSVDGFVPLSNLILPFRRLDATLILSKVYRSDAGCSYSLDLLAYSFRVLRR